VTSVAAHTLSGCAVATRVALRETRAIPYKCAIRDFGELVRNAGVLESKCVDLSGDLPHGIDGTIDFVNADHTLLYLSYVSSETPAPAWQISMENLTQEILFDDFENKWALVPELHYRARPGMANRCSLNEYEKRFNLFEMDAKA